MQVLKDDVRDKMMTAAREEFLEQGFSGASMRSIAQRTGMTTGNIYRYFESKERLFTALIQPVYDQVVFYGDSFSDEVLRSSVNYRNFDSMTLIRDIYSRILQVFTLHGPELLILLEKSDASPFSGTKDRIKQRIHDIMAVVYVDELRNEGKEIQDPYILYVISSILIEGICDILRTTTDGRRVRFLVQSLAEIVFHQLSGRINGPEPDSAKN